MKPHQKLLFAEPAATRAPAVSPNERVSVKLWLLDDSPTKAAKFLCAPEMPAATVWVPRSLMGDRISKFRDPGCAFQRWEFTLPQWKAAELGINQAETRP